MVKYLLTLLIVTIVVSSQKIDQTKNEVEIGSKNSNVNNVEEDVVDWVVISKSPSTTIRRPEGSLIELECQATGSPAISLQWLKGNFLQWLKESTPVIKSDSFDPSKGYVKRVLRFVINSATIEDEGTYTCLAKNGLRVTTSTRKVYISKIANYTQTSTKQIKSQPWIIVYDDTHMSNFGSDVMLPCKAIGIPKPTITWLDPSKQPIQNNSKYTVLTDGTLKIKNIKWDDMEFYTCVAQNSVGEDSSLTFLYPMLIN